MRRGIFCRSLLQQDHAARFFLTHDYTDFQDYWSSFSTGPSRIAQGLTALPPELRSKIEQHVRARYLAGLPNGPRSFAIIVRAVRGLVPRA